MKNSSAIIVGGIEPGMTMIDLSAIPFVDAHMHPPLRHRGIDVDRLLGHWYEGPRSNVGAARNLIAFRHSLHLLARHLGCEPTPESVAAGLAAREWSARWADVVRSGAIAALVVDTGHPLPELACGTDEIATLSGVPVAPLMRIEEKAGAIARTATSFAAFVEEFDAIVGSARSNGFAGFKSVIAYRSGLRIAEADAGAAQAAFASDPGRATGRLQAKPLLDHLLLHVLRIARRDEMPVQLHCGYGDADIDLLLGNPLHLQWLLEGPGQGVRFVLLHGAFPYTREAAWLSAVYPHVYVDVCSCIPPLAVTAIMAMWRDVLSVAPTHQIHASTDATGLPEQSMVGAWLGREALSGALGELHALGALSAAEIDRIALAVLHDNARHLYQC